MPGNNKSGNKKKKNKRNSELTIVNNNGNKIGKKDPNSAYELLDLDIQNVRTDPETWDRQPEHHCKGCEKHHTRWCNALTELRQKAQPLYEKIMYLIQVAKKVISLPDYNREELLKYHEGMIEYTLSKAETLDLDDSANGSPYARLDDMRLEIQRIKEMMEALEEFIRTGSKIERDLRSSSVKDKALLEEAYSTVLLSMESIRMKQIEDMARDNDNHDDNEDENDLAKRIQETSLGDNTETSDKSPDSSSEDTSSSSSDDDSSEDERGGVSASEKLIATAKPAVDATQASGGATQSGGKGTSLPKTILFGGSPRSGAKSTFSPSSPSIAKGTSTEKAIQSLITQAAGGGGMPVSTKVMRSVTVTPLGSLQDVAKVKQFINQASSLSMYTTPEEWLPYITNDLLTDLVMMEELEPTRWGCFNQWSLGKFTRTLEEVVLRSQEEQHASNFSEAMNGVKIRLDPKKLTSFSVVEALREARKRCTTFKDAISEMQKTKQGRQDILKVLCDLVQKGYSSTETDSTGKPKAPIWSKGKLPADEGTVKLRAQVIANIKTRSALPPTDGRYVGSVDTFFKAVIEETTGLAESFMSAKGVFQELASATALGAPAQGQKRNEHHSSREEQGNHKKARYDDSASSNNQGKRIFCNKCKRTHPGGEAECRGVGYRPPVNNTAGAAPTWRTSGGNDSSKSLGLQLNEATQDKQAQRGTIINQLNNKLGYQNKVLASKPMQKTLKALIVGKDVDDETKQFARTMVKTNSKKKNKSKANDDDDA